jgi:hypothetical protein
MHLQTFGIHQDHGLRIYSESEAPGFDDDLSARQIQLSDIRDLRGCALIRDYRQPDTVLSIGHNPLWCCRRWVYYQRHQSDDG